MIAAYRAIFHLIINVRVRYLFRDSEARHYNKMMINRSIVEKRAGACAVCTHSGNNLLVPCVCGHITTDTAITGQIVKRKYTSITHSTETSLCVRATCNYSVNWREINYSACAKESPYHGTICQIHNTDWLWVLYTIKLPIAYGFVSVTHARSYILQKLRGNCWSKLEKLICHVRTATILINKRYSE